MSEHQRFLDACADFAKRRDNDGKPLGGVPDEAKSGTVGREYILRDANGEELAAYDMNVPSKLTLLRPGVPQGDPGRFRRPD